MLRHLTQHNHVPLSRALRLLKTRWIWGASRNWSLSSVSFVLLVGSKTPPEKPERPDRSDRPEKPNEPVGRTMIDKAKTLYLATGWLADSMAARIFSRLLASNSCP